MLDYPPLLATDPIVVYSEGPRKGIATLLQLVGYPWSLGPRLGPVCSVIYLINRICDCGEQLHQKLSQVAALQIYRDDPL